jgi:hypothetical protein
VTATYLSPAPPNDVTVTSTTSTVLSLDLQTDGYYLISFRAGVEAANPSTEIVTCMLTGGLVNGANLIAGDLFNNVSLVSSPKGTVSATLPVEVNSSILSTTTVSLTCLATTTGTVSERSITATPITRPTFRF